MDATRFNTQLLQGEQASDVIPDLARLRLSIFREYPYLYDGRSEDEHRYLRLYAGTPDAFVITVSDSKLITGTTSKDLKRMLKRFTATSERTSSHPGKEKTRYRLDTVPGTVAVLILPTNQHH